MKMLWISWKDRSNPLAGGAEVVADQLCQRLVKDGHEVILLTAGFQGSQARETYKGYTIIRVGSRWSVYVEAYRYYKENLKGWADVVLEEINTLPFFTQYYVKERRVLLFHQLCRQIWFYQMVFPLSLVGYLLEPFYLWLLRKSAVITVSQSTKADLCRYGFKADSISIISEGIEIKRLSDLNSIEKYPDFTLLSLGAIRPMKRTLEQLKAFTLLKKTQPNLTLKIAGGGEGAYFNRVMTFIQNSEYKADIEYVGRVNDEQKIELMQKCHLILVTSVKEGWGLIVTEANSQGTPAAVYDVDGLRDSVKHQVTGKVVPQKPEALAEAIAQLVTNPEQYKAMRLAAWQSSERITFDQAYQDLLAILKP